jgi:hypothetical protein
MELLLKPEGPAGRLTAERAETGEPFGPLVDRVLATPFVGVEVGVPALEGLRAGVDEDGFVDGARVVPPGGGCLCGAPDIV